MRDQNGDLLRFVRREMSTMSRSRADTACPRPSQKTDELRAGCPAGARPLRPSACEPRPRQRPGVSSNPCVRASRDSAAHRADPALNRVFSSMQKTRSCAIEIHRSRPRLRLELHRRRSTVRAERCSPPAATRTIGATPSFRPSDRVPVCASACRRVHVRARFQPVSTSLRATCAPIPPALCRERCFHSYRPRTAASSRDVRSCALAATEDPPRRAPSHNPTRTTLVSSAQR